MAKKSRGALWDELMVYAGQLESTFRTSFLEAVAAAKASPLVTRELTELMQRGDWDGALALLLRGWNAEALATMARDLTAQTASRFSSGVLVLGSLSLGGVTFDAYNPFAVQFLRDYKLDLITRITTETREGIRQYLIDGVKRGVNPIATARQVRTLIGLTPKQTQAVANYRHELETGDIEGALSRKLRDARFDRTVGRMDDTALTQAQVERLVTRYTERQLKFRAEMISRTESLRALNQGQRLALQHAQATGFFTLPLIRRWYPARDERVCPICQGIPALNPDGRGLDEPFFTDAGEVMDPPVHPNCRCVTFPELA